jgi:hypothetical protein
MAAFDELDAGLQKALLRRVAVRQERYIAMNNQRWKPMNGEILLMGDRPAPSAPNDPTFHFTPFAALTHSSLYLNVLLEQFAIDEEQLGWMNAYDRAGIATDTRPLSYRWSHVFALGFSPSSFLTKAGVPHTRVMHPQAWKRFHSKEPYPLIGLLSLATC